VSTLCKVIHVVVGAVVADLFRGGAECIFVFADQLCILDLFGFERSNSSVGFEELRFQFADLCSWTRFVNDWLKSPSRSR
jgi:hypothetical protein